MKHNLTLLSRVTTVINNLHTVWSCHVQKDLSAVSKWQGSHWAIFKWSSLISCEGLRSAFHVFKIFISSFWNFLWIPWLWILSCSQLEFTRKLVDVAKVLSLYCSLPKLMVSQEKEKEHLGSSDWCIVWGGGPLYFILLICLLLNQSTLSSSSDTVFLP